MWRDGAGAAVLKSCTAAVDVEADGALRLNRPNYK